MHKKWNISVKAQTKATLYLFIYSYKQHYTYCLLIFEEKKEQILNFYCCVLVLVF